MGGIGLLIDRDPANPRLVAPGDSAGKRLARIDDTLTSLRAAFRDNHHDRE
jgi:hypothetical protein